jgi:hypothetical protein
MISAATPWTTRWSISHHEFHFPLGLVIFDLLHWFIQSVFACSWARLSFRSSTDWADVFSSPARWMAGLFLVLYHFTSGRTRVYYCRLVSCSEMCISITLLIKVIVVLKFNLWLTIIFTIGFELVKPLLLIHHLISKIIPARLSTSIISIWKQPTKLISLNMQAIHLTIVPHHQISSLNHYFFSPELPRSLLKPTSSVSGK